MPVVALLRVPRLLLRVVRLLLRLRVAAPDALRVVPVIPLCTALRVEADVPRFVTLRVAPAPLG